MPLIVFEGIDGCGKSTQCRLLRQRLDDAGHQHHFHREPGGTALGERIRDILLDPATQAGARAEVFGYQMARAQLVDECLRPQLASGAIVILDRFYHSTLAYQGYGLGLDPDRIGAAVALACDDLRPDIALYLRVPLARCLQRRGATDPDRIEARGQDYLQRVADGYETLLGYDNLVAVNGDAPAEAVAEAIWALVAPLLV